MPAPLPLTPVLLGPTAVGKTAVAAALAARLPLVIISADARQIYRRLDIGTAKPDAAFRARVPHHGLDLVDPGERYSAGQFGRDAAGWIAAAPAGRTPLVVGGSGFYVRALTDGLFHEPPLEPPRRARLRAWTDRLAGPALAQWASRLDPRFAGGGRQRAARALEVALLTGRSLSWWQREARAAGAIRPWYVVLTVPRDVLRRRIAQRTGQMLAAGLAEEVLAELARGTAPDAPGLDGIGYRQVVAVLSGAAPASGLAEAIALATRRYAKRQETWLRHQLRPQTADVSRQPDSIWTLDASESPDALAAVIADRWRSASGV